MGAILRIDIYSDTICPWCFLGKRRLESALAMRPRYEPRVHWRPFELNPDMPVEGLDRAWFLATRVADIERFKQNEALLTGLGEAVGIAFRFDLIGRLPNTRRSHLLIAHAATQGRQAQVNERIMRAYFEEGADIGDVEELVRLGIEAGLTEADCRRVLVLRFGQDAIIAAERHATALGLSGVPALVFDGEYTLSGAQGTDALVRAMDQVAEAAAARER